MKNISLFLLLLCTVTGYAQAKKTYEIGILIDLELPELSPLLDELKSEVEAVVGEDAIIVFPSKFQLANDLDLAKAETQYQTLINSEVDIILAFGVVNNQLLLQKNSFQKPTILFGGFNRDLNKIDESDINSIENFINLTSSKSYTDDLQRFKELTGFENVGIVIQEQFLNFFDYKPFFDALLPQLNASYRIISFKDIEDIKSNLNDIDALYLAEGYYLSDNEMASIAEACIDLKISSFTSNSVDDVKNGILATNQSEQNLTQFFRRIALTVESYIGGEEISELPNYISFNDALSVNINTAEKIGLDLKYSLIANTNFIGDFDEVYSEKKYNLKEVMDQVLSNNLELQSSAKEVELFEKDVQTAWANYLPSIAANASFLYVDPKFSEITLGLNPEFSTTGNVSFGQTLFSADANANINIQKDRFESQKQRYSALQLDLIFEASNAYINSLILKANLKIQATNMDLTKTNLQIAEENFESGQKSKSDVLRFRSEFAQTTQATVESVNSLSQSFFNLNLILNNNINYDIDVDEVELETGLYANYNYRQLRELLDTANSRGSLVDFLVEEAKKNAPELKALDYDISANGRTIRLNSEGRFIPTLALQGQYNRNFNQWGAGVNPNALAGNYNLGVNLSIPIVDQNRKNINRQIGLLQKDQLDINRSNINLSISTNVNNAVLDILNEVANIELSTVSEASAKEAFELTQASYANGAVNIVQLLDAQNNYLNASLAKANAIYTYLLASLRLERFVGYYFLMHSEEENADFIARFLTYYEQNRN